jgi:hypothetical protein
LLQQRANVQIVVNFFFALRPTLICLSRRPSPRAAASVPSQTLPQRRSQARATAWLHQLRGPAIAAQRLPPITRTRIEEQTPDLRTRAFSSTLIPCDNRHELLRVCISAPVITAQFFLDHQIITKRANWQKPF